MNVNFKESLNNIEYFQFNSNYLIFTFGQSDSILIYDLQNKKINQTIENEAFSFVCSTPEQNVMVTSTLNCSLNIYDLNESSKKFSLIKNIKLENFYSNYQKKGFFFFLNTIYLKHIS